MNDSISSSTDSQDSITEENIEKPGDMLKTARQRTGMSVDEVARALYLTRSKVHALENDDYEKLQSRVFIKGYLRKYAPLVGLDGEQLVQNYEKLTSHLDQALDQFDEQSEEIPNTLVPKFIIPAALFGLAAVVLATVFVFVDKPGQRGNPRLNPASELDTALEQGVAASGVASAEQPNLDRELAREAREFAVQEAAVAEAASLPAAKTPTSNSAPAASAAPSSRPLSEAAQQAELRFEFSEDCWLEVRDQFDTILYTDIAKAGESLELQGEPPYAISLGNAQAVTLYWGDEMIDTQPRPGFRTAKLVVGETTSTR